MDKIPCRVTAELNQHLNALEKREEIRFDPWDDGLFQDLFGPVMAPYLASLLIALEQVERTELSFGADKEKAFDFLRPHLQALKDACLETFRQL